MHAYLWLIPALPLIGFLLNGLGRKVFPKSLTGLIANLALALSFVLSLLVFWQVKDPAFKPVEVHLFNFFSAGSLHVSFDFYLDQLTSLFLLIITGVGFLIHLYSIGYMHEEKPEGFARYFSYLNFFVFNMLILVMGANYVVMFIGWEGVGLSSYLLIGFWFRNKDFTAAARKAFVMNRIGDLGFLIGIFLMFKVFDSVAFSDVYSQAAQLTSGNAVITAMTLLLFVGATGKSAQIPLYTWLPDAMAGPTPVSALIHAATMVTAGIYMIARSHVLYTLAPFTSAIIALVGAFTAVLAASIALQQNDIKKVLAYSTVSQLGYMFLGLGVGAYMGAVFHVMTHAFFKALLFLGAGSVIHAMGGEQNMVKMGGLRKSMPVTYITFFVGCLALGGIPPFSGFFSKDEILSAAFASSPLLYILGLLGALMTAFYAFRALALTFHGKFRGSDEEKKHLHESPSVMTIPLIVLAILAAIGGFVGMPDILGGFHPLAHFLDPVFETPGVVVVHQTLSPTTEGILMVLSSVLVIGMAIWSFRKYAKFKPALKPAKGIILALKNAWYINELYDTVIVKPLHRLAKWLDNVVEREGIDAAVDETGNFVKWAGGKVRLLQTGQVGYYLFAMVIGVLVLLWIALF